jgi:hypothetical protein
MHDEAWDELLPATPRGWFVGKPTFDEHRAVPWSIYAFDTTERLKAGRRKREWTAIGPTEEQVIRTMAYCLREIGAGRVPQ